MNISVFLAHIVVAMLAEGWKCPKYLHLQGPFFRFRQFMMSISLALNLRHGTASRADSHSPLTGTIDSDGEPFLTYAQTKHASSIMPPTHAKSKASDSDATHSRLRKIRDDELAIKRMAGHVSCAECSRYVVAYCLSIRYGLSYTLHIMIL